MLLYVSSIYVLLIMTPSTEFCFLYHYFTLTVVGRHIVIVRFFSYPYFCTLYRITSKYLYTGVSVRCPILCNMQYGNNNETINESHLKQLIFKTTRIYNKLINRYSAIKQKWQSDKTMLNYNIDSRRGE